MQLFATAARGSEPALRDELRELRLRHVRADRGGVHFEGDLVEAARVCLWSSVAVRVLCEIGQGPAQDADALYQTVRAIDFRQHLSPAHTLSVSAVSQRSGLTHTAFIAQRTKDAIVDQLRDALGARPDVDRTDADVKVFVLINRDDAKVFLDVSGDPLHRRGYRDVQAEASLKETLAATCVRMSGWDRTSPFLDPMCGSGTIAIEAARLSRNIAPGILREKFGVERWASADETLRSGIARLRQEARASVRSDGPPIYAGDIDEGVLAYAERNAKRAGVSLHLHCDRVGDLRRPAPHGAMVTNAPYGDRLDADRALFDEIGRGVRSLVGWRATILSGSPDLEDAIGLRPAMRHALWNGAIECRLLGYDLTDR